ncbi:MAG: leucine-rich repeat domain-containing protein [Vicinamibacterales bacterium]|nr:leucine-rich repeat domain-containing protein [Vicinamibacterales bacterium]
MSDKDQDAFKASGTSPTYRLVARVVSIGRSAAGAVLERSRATVAARRRFTEVSSDCEDTAHAEPVKGLNRRAFLKSAGMTAVAGAVGTGTTSTQAELFREAEREVEQDPILDVVFPDKYLEDAVREALEKFDGPLTRGDLESLEELEAPESGIKDLTGLGHCVNLTELWLTSNEISDITPLAALTNLTQLNLSYNPISDVTPLAALTDVGALDLAVNQINDIRPLLSLTNLTQLTLDYTHLSQESLKFHVPTLQSTAFVDNGLRWPDGVHGNIRRRR